MQFSVAIHLVFRHLLDACIGTELLFWKFGVDYTELMLVNLVALSFHLHIDKYTEFRCSRTLRLLTVTTARTFVPGLSYCESCVY